MLRIHRDERGQSLVIVLSLITILFLLGSSLAVHSSVALRTTRAGATQSDEFYAADAATEVGIWWQRNGKAGKAPSVKIKGIDTDVTITSAGGGGGSCPADNTPLWMSGFEGGVAPSTSGALAGTTSQGGAVADTTVVRTGTYSARISPAGGWTDMWIQQNQGIAFGPSNVFHFAFQFGTLPPSDANVFKVAAGGSGSLYVYYKASTGKWTLALGSWATRVEIGGSVGPTAGQWQTIDIRYQTSTNSLVGDWYVDGVAQPQLTAASLGTTTSTVVGFGQASGTTTATYTGYFDDVMISKTLSDWPLPDIRISGLKPNGMGTNSTPGNYQQVVGATAGSPPTGGTSSAMTATSWQTVDELPITSTTDYIKEITAGATSYVELAFENTTQTCVRGASLFAGVQATTSQGLVLGLNSVTNGVNYTIYSGSIGNANLRYVQGAVTQNTSNPGTGPWTQAIVNGITARFGMSTDVSPVPYLHGIILEYAWMNAVATPATITIVGVGGSSTVTTTYSDAGAGIPSLSTWTTTR
jgi:Tfp pilus assembly protein PilX